MSSWGSSCKAISHVSPALTSFIKACYKDGVIWFSTGAVMLYNASQVILPVHGIYHHYQRSQGKKCFCHFVFLATIKRKKNWLRTLISKAKIFYKSDVFNLYMVRSRFGGNYQVLNKGGCKKSGRLAVQEHYRLQDTRIWVLLIWGFHSQDHFTVQEGC